MRLGMFMMPVHPPDRTFWSTLEEDAEKSVLADRLGFDEVWMGEHFSATTEPIPSPPQPAKSRSPGRSTVPASDLNAVAGIWDDMVAGIRRDRPFVATLLEQSLPVSTNANGVLVLQVETPAVQEGLAAKMSEIVGTMSNWLVGLQKLNVRLAGDSIAGPAPRMTVESVRSDTLAALRKRDPLLDAAIDALDLDLID